MGDRHVTLFGKPYRWVYRTTQHGTLDHYRITDVTLALVSDHITHPTQEGT
jgi:hypothetical protein